jgi:Ca2+/Na+ antiporter
MRINMFITSGILALLYVITLILQYSQTGAISQMDITGLVVIILLYVYIFYKFKRVQNDS